MRWGSTATRWVIRATTAGRTRRCYAYAREDLDWWETELGAPIPDGGFGENLTTQDIDVNAAEIGERWRIGEALLEVRSIRIPCATFRGWQGRNGFDTTSWQKRFTAAARPGPYLRVLGEGPLAAGDEIEVVHRPGHGVTVATMFRACTGEFHLLPDLLRVDDLVPEARRRAEKYLASPTVTAAAAPHRVSRRR